MRAAYNSRRRRGRRKGDDTVGAADSLGLGTTAEARRQPRFTHGQSSAPRVSLLGGDAGAGVGVAEAEHPAAAIEGVEPADASSSPKDVEAKAGSAARTAAPQTAPSDAPATPATRAPSPAAESARPGPAEVRSPTTPDLSTPAPQQMQKGPDAAEAGDVTRPGEVPGTADAGGGAKAKEEPAPAAPGEQTPAEATAPTTADPSAEAGPSAEARTPGAAEAPQTAEGDAGSHVVGAKPVDSTTPVGSPTPVASPTAAGGDKAGVVPDGRAAPQAGGQQTGGQQTGGQQTNGQQTGAPAPEAPAAEGHMATPAKPVYGARAGAKLAAPAEPETLSRQLPDRELTEEEYNAETASGSTPEVRRAQVAAMLDGLSADAAREKAAVNDAAGRQKAEVSATADEQAASVRSSVRTNVASIRSAFKYSRDQLTALNEKEKGGLTERTVRLGPNMTSEEQVKIDVREMSDLIDAQKKRLMEPPQDDTLDLYGVATDEFLRGVRKFDAARDTARRVGEKVAAEYREQNERDAAHAVARAAADSLRDAEPDLNHGLLDMMHEAHERRGQAAGPVTYELEALKPVASEAVDGLFVQARSHAMQAIEPTEEALDKRLASDLAMLDEKEKAAVAEVRGGGERTIAGIRRTARRARGEIDAAAAALTTDIDNRVAETAAVVSAESDPYPPGVSDVVGAVRKFISETGAGGRDLLAEGAANARAWCEESASHFVAAAPDAAEAARGQASFILRRGRDLVKQILRKHDETIPKIEANLAEARKTYKADFSGEVLKGVDSVIATLDADNRKVADMMVEAADVFVTDVTGQALDGLEESCRDAADAANGWFAGLVADIAAGAAVAVALAFVVAFVFSIPFITALFIVGAVFLVHSFVTAFQRRKEQFAGTDRGTLEALAYAFGDATGLTGVYEGATGHEVVTGRKLTSAQRGRRAASGGTTLVTTFLGARGARPAFSALKTRPISRSGGFRGAVRKRVERAKDAAREVGRKARGVAEDVRVLIDDLYDVARGKSRRGCFAAGTPVLAGRGHVPIESLAEGDTVVALDPATGVRARQRVARVFSFIAPSALRVRAGTAEVVCTTEHPFWVPGEGWTKAGDLRAGARLLGEDGADVFVESVERVGGPLRVYNIEIEGLHTYFVAKPGLLVHNKPMDVAPVGKLTKVDAAWLKKQGIDPHDLKKAELDAKVSKYDIYVDRRGNLFGIRKGNPESTAEYLGNVRDFKPNASGAKGGGTREGETPAEGETPTQPKDKVEGESEGTPEVKREGDDGPPREPEPPAPRAPEWHPIDKKALPDRVIQELTDRPGFEMVESWEVRKVEGPRKVAEVDPVRPDAQHLERYQIRFWDDFSKAYEDISVNYDPATGLFGTIKRAGGKQR